MLAQVRVGVVKRSKAIKTRTPNEIASERPALASKLAEPASWNEKRTTSTNYCRASLARDPNRALHVRRAVAAAGELLVQIDCTQPSVIVKVFDIVSMLFISLR